jgi:hypothetical protein
MSWRPSAGGRASKSDSGLVALARSLPRCPVPEDLLVPIDCLRAAPLNLSGVTAHRSHEDAWGPVPSGVDVPGCASSALLDQPLALVAAIRALLA